MAAINWTDEALRWVDEIHDYIAKDNAPAAYRTIRGIFDRVQILAYVCTENAIRYMSSKYAYPNPTMAPLRPRITPFFLINKDAQNRIQLNANIKDSRQGGVRKIPIESSDEWSKQSQSERIAIAKSGKGIR